MAEMGEKEEPLAERVVVIWGLLPLGPSDVLGALKRNSVVIKISQGTEVLLGGISKL